MLINPKYVKFNSTNDVVDYVTLGLPPTDKNMESIIDMLRKYKDDPDVIRGIDTPLSFNPYIYKENDPETVAKVLARVNENRKTNAKIGLGLAMIGAPILLMLLKR